MTPQLLTSPSPQIENSLDALWVSCPIVEWVELQACTQVRSKTSPVVRKMQNAGGPLFLDNLKRLSWVFLFHVGFL